MSLSNLNSVVIAEQFHAAYENLAPTYGYKTRDESAVPWQEVPAANRQLMEATVEALLDAGVILPGPKVKEVLDAAF